MPNAPGSWGAKVTRTNPSEMDELALWLQCSFCDSEPGEWCRTRSNRLADYLHGARTWPLWEARSNGYQEGQAGILCTLADTGSDEWEQRWLNRMVAEHRAKCEWKHHEVVQG